MDALRDLVTHCNLYFRDTKTVNAFLLQDIGVYVTEILKVFGTIVERKEHKIGFPISNDNCAISVSVNNSYSGIFCKLLL